MNWLRIYTIQLRTSRTDYDSATNPKIGGQTATGSSEVNGAISCYLSLSEGLNLLLFSGSFYIIVLYFKQSLSECYE